MKVSDELLDMLAIQYTTNYEDAKDEFQTFNEYVLNYVSKQNRKLKEAGYTV